MRVPTARGPISALVRAWPTGASRPDLAAAEDLCGTAGSDPITDDDRQVALWMLYALHYGGFVDVEDAGEPARQHAELFRTTLEGCDLDSEYGAHFDQVPTVLLAVNNAMSLFGLHQCLRASAMGHLAAFETTSSLPARRLFRGLRRLGFPAVAAEYYDGHVEADAVHEQVAVRVICGALVAEGRSATAVSQRRDLGSKTGRGASIAWTSEQARARASPRSPPGRGAGDSHRAFNHRP